MGWPAEAEAYTSVLRTHGVFTKNAHALSHKSCCSNFKGLKTSVSVYFVAYLKLVWKRPLPLISTKPTSLYMNIKPSFKRYYQIHSENKCSVFFLPSSFINQVISQDIQKTTFQQKLFLNNLLTINAQNPATLKTHHAVLVLLKRSSQKS